MRVPGERELMKTAAVTHVGLVKEQNQDRFLIKEFSGDSVLIAVADGAGGTPAGQEASGVVIERINDFQPDSPTPEASLVRLMQEADQKIFGIVEKEPDLKGIGQYIDRCLCKRRSRILGTCGRQQALPIPRR